MTLPADMDRDSFDTLSTPDKRLLLSEAFAAVVVRRASSWREPVSDRTRILTRNEAPTGLALIGHVAGLTR